MNYPIIHPTGIWEKTAIPGIDFPSALGKEDAQICIIGAGFLGLSAAIELSAHGYSVFVLESETPGWGASGRNGGQVIPGLKYDPEHLLSKLGPERGKRAIRFGASTADKVFDMIKHYQLKVPHHRNGWIQAAHNQEGLKLAWERARQWESYGVKGIEKLSEQNTTKLLGTHVYKGGWLDPRAGALQPLTLTREMARVAKDQGVKIFSHSKVIDIVSDGEEWVVKTPDAQIRCHKVIVATNAYTENLLPKASNSIVAAHSFMLATEPLPDTIRKTIFCQGHSCSDTRRLLHYIRLDHEGRLLLGGRGSFYPPQKPNDWNHLEKVLYKIYPQTIGLKIESRWFGRVAMTQDFFPHIHEPFPRFIVNMGCMGRGLALQIAMGIRLAEYIDSGNPKVLPFDITPLKAIPLPFFRRWQIEGLIRWYAFLDNFR